MGWEMERSLTGESDSAGGSLTRVRGRITRKKVENLSKLRQGRSPDDPKGGMKG